jgi:hypothetical protein
MKPRTWLSCGDRRRDRRTETTHAELPTRAIISCKLEWRLLWSNFKHDPASLLFAMFSLMRSPKIGGAKNVPMRPDESQRGHAQVKSRGVLRRSESLFVYHVRHLGNVAAVVSFQHVDQSLDAAPSHAFIRIRRHARNACGTRKMRI